MIVDLGMRAELLAAGWAEPVTEPVRLDTLAHIARNLGSDLMAVLPDGTAFVSPGSDRHERFRFFQANLSREAPPALAVDLIDWAAELDGPVRCWMV